MLSEEDVAYFRRRIGEVLQDRRVTEWQRQFLSDMRQKMDCYESERRSVKSNSQYSSV